MTEMVGFDPSLYLSIGHVLNLPNYPLRVESGLELDSVLVDALCGERFWVDVELHINNKIYGIIRADLLSSDLKPFSHKRVAVDDFYIVATTFK